jgi:hypothetical protein
VGAVRRKRRAGLEELVCTSKKENIIIHLEERNPRRAT